MNKSKKFKILISLLLSAFLLSMAGCSDAGETQDDGVWYETTPAGEEGLSEIYWTEPPETDDWAEMPETAAWSETAEANDWADAEETVNRADDAERGMTFWNQVIFETVAMLQLREDLPFTASESALQEMYDYLRDISPKELKTAFERNLRIEYTSIYERLFTFEEADGDVFESMGRALRFAEILLGEQEDLFEMAADDYENVYGTQSVSISFALFFDAYLSGFTPDVTEKTKPGNHAVIFVYPENDSPAWEVYFHRDSAEEGWKITKSFVRG